MYSTIIKDKYGKFPKYLCFNCFKNKEFIKEIFDITKYEKIMKEFDSEVDKIINAESFPPNIDYFSCKFICGVHNDCIYWNQR